jgi:hypothetical protein
MTMLALAFAVTRNGDLDPKSKGQERQPLGFLCFDSIVKRAPFEMRWSELESSISERMCECE